jgi:hypothetical protein
MKFNSRFTNHISVYLTVDLNKDYSMLPKELQSENSFPHANELKPSHTICYKETFLSSLLT